MLIVDTKYEHDDWKHYMEILSGNPMVFYHYVSIENDSVVKLSLDADGAEFLCFMHLFQIGLLL